MKCCEGLICMVGSAAEATAVTAAAEAAIHLQAEIIKYGAIPP